jgi:hypothetical protein
MRAVKCTLRKLAREQQQNMRHLFCTSLDIWKHFSIHEGVECIVLIILLCLQMRHSSLIRLHLFPGIFICHTVSRLLIRWRQTCGLVISIPEKWCTSPGLFRSAMSAACAVIAHALLLAKLLSPQDRTQPESVIQARQFSRPYGIAFTTDGGKQASGRSAR